jgi:hypothetical protein
MEIRVKNLLSCLKKAFSNPHRFLLELGLTVILAIELFRFIMFVWHG